MSVASVFASLVGFLPSSWKKYARYIGIGVAILIIGYLAYVWFSTQLENSDLKVENQQLISQVASWSSKYNTAVLAFQESSKEVTKLKEKQAALDKSLLEWKSSYDQIADKYSLTQSKIKTLEKQNATIRDMLAVNIPADLWRVYFPVATGDSKRDQN